jgi:TonB-dependent SusC/RagA subfamily outer membrane receptor
VQVIQTQGVIGSSPNIRIRGVGSLSLNNEPLVVVDGIRFSNEAEPGNVSGVRINRLSTLDPEDVESIDVIRGPSAAALYGTAAANGVVVIKTKRGRSGGTKWSAFVENGVTQMPGGYPANYWTFGRNIVNGVPVTGAAPVHCTLAGSAQNQCVIDSTSSFNPWTNSMTDPFKEWTILAVWVPGLRWVERASLLRQRRSSGRHRSILHARLRAESHHDQARRVAARGTDSAEPAASNVGARELHVRARAERDARSFRRVSGPRPVDAVRRHLLPGSVETNSSRPRDSRRPPTAPPANSSATSSPSASATRWSGSPVLVH